MAVLCSCQWHSQPEDSLPGLHSIAFTLIMAGNTPGRAAESGWQGQLTSGRRVAVLRMRDMSKYKEGSPFWLLTVVRMLLGAPASLQAHSGNSECKTTSIPSLSCQDAANALLAFSLLGGSPPSPTHTNGPPYLCKLSSSIPRC